MKVKIDSEEKLVHNMREAINIMVNMRKFQKLWEESYGVELKNKKKRWEEKADQFLLSLGDCPGIVINS